MQVQSRGQSQWWGVAPLWLAACVGLPLTAAALTFKVDQHYHSAADTVASGAGGMLFLAAGVVAHLRRPETRVGLLMVLVGVALPAEDLQLSTTPWVHTAGLLFPRASSAVLTHLVLAFPTGRLTTRTRRELAAAAYAVAFGLTPIRALFTNNERLPIPRRNLLLVVDSKQLSGQLDRAASLLAAAVAVAVLVILARRWAGAGRPLRRVLAPVYLATALGGAATAAGGLLGPGQPWREQSMWVSLVALWLLPLGFVVGVLRLRMGRGAVDRLLVRLREPVSAAQLRTELAQALGDLSLQVGYAQTETGTFVDGDGQPMTLPAADTERCTRMVERGGRRVAVLLHDPALRENPALLDVVTSVAGLALENQRLTAEVRAQLVEVRASRGRIVAAADAARRELERDLHDGAQQRLVVVALTLMRARQRLGGTVDPRGAQLLADCADGLDAAIGELRELARGLHPAILTDAGLLPALRGLAERCPLDVHLRPAPPPVLGRLNPSAEAAAYFVVAEALANTLKHAQATGVWITVGYSYGALRVEIVDDGVGGAGSSAGSSAGFGSGLLGLRDRVAALDGTLTVRSEPGAGTRIAAVIPCAHVPQARRESEPRQRGYAT
ncbi:sensor histidine kinase [Frankia sp. QA3]|uniref:sensor histidine kinase n=1 Tax=Frankia sp. QA3 TaxID=710111 RepID=UPI0002F6FB3E|nr:ATP-binding protein [Frankia sp. QA3]